MKDLSWLGRSLEKILIVDNNPENFLLQPENGIYIKSWYENPEDRALIDLEKVLIQLAETKCKDLWIGLKKLANQQQKYEIDLINTWKNRYL